MDLLEQRGTPFAQPFDDRELPERARPVERAFGERAAEVEDRPIVARCGESDDVDVGLQVEGRIVGELRRHDAQRRADDALAAGAGC